MSSKINFIQKAKSKLCIRPFKICGKAEFSINESTLIETSIDIKEKNTLPLNEKTLDSFKTTIIASSLDNERDLSQANETINISKFPFLVCSPEQCRTKRDDFSAVNNSPHQLDQSNESFKENFTQMWVESFGFNSNDFQSANSNFFQQTIEQSQIQLKPEILSHEPIFV